MRCRACNSTTFVGGQSEPKFCPRCGNAFADKPYMCGATHPAIDGGAPCVRQPGHVNNPERLNPERHCTANGLWWNDEKAVLT